MIKAGKQRVHFDGPFYTGYFIETGSLMDMGYSVVQKQVLSALTAETQLQWAIEGSSDSELLWDSSYENIYGGTPMVPASFLIHRPEKIMNSQSICEGVTFTIVDAIFYIHDYGTGVYRIMVEVDLHRDYETIEYRKLVEKYSNTLSKVIDPCINECLVELDKILEQVNVPLTSYSEIAEKLQSKGNNFIPLRRSLWFHRIFHFSTENKVSVEDAKPYMDLLYSTQQIGPQNCSLTPYAVVYPAFGYSLSIANDEMTKEIDLDRMIDIAEYYYAATSLLDTILFTKFAEYSVKKRDPKIQELEGDLHEVKELAEQLELFLLILKDSIINLSPSSTLIWRMLEKEWYYMPILEALRDKNDLLNIKLKELVDELAQKRSATLNRFVKIFTVFAVFGPAIEIYAFLQDRDIITTLLSLDPSVYLIIGLAGAIIGITLGVTAVTVFRKYF
jgi:hypothetical protein